MKSITISLFLVFSIHPLLCQSVINFEASGIYYLEIGSMLAKSDNQLVCSNCEIIFFSSKSRNLGFSNEVNIENIDIERPIFIQASKEGSVFINGGYLLGELVKISEFREPQEPDCTNLKYIVIDESSSMTAEELKRQKAIIDQLSKLGYSGALNSIGKHISSSIKATNGDEVLGSLIKDAKVNNGEIVLITDGLSNLDSTFSEIKSFINNVVNSDIKVTTFHIMDSFVVKDLFFRQPEVITDLSQINYWGLNIECAKANYNYKVYPNLLNSSDRIFIESSHIDSAILQLCDLTGKVFISDKMDGQFHTLPVFNMPAGTYFLSINQSETHKIIIQ